jgi:3-oxoacyl-(acyl-carrier-protein) synthase
VSDKDIYVRGWGAVTTLGWSAPESAKNLIEGKVRPAKAGEASHLISSEFKSFAVPYDGDHLSKSQKMLEGALDEAIERAGLSPSEITESSLFVGTTGGFFIRNEYEFTEEIRRNPQKESPPISGRNRGPGEVTQAIADKYGIKGMTFTLSMACVSSSHALVVAAKLLEQKKIKRAIVFGFEPLLNLTLHGFSSLLLCDYDQCRPFCATRSGMQIGEGAGAVILERGDKARYAKSVYKFAGGYLFNDNSSLTSGGLDGELVKEVVAQTLSLSRVSASEIVAIKAHGTGTKDNDLSEGLGLHKLFGEKLSPVVSLKGALGHALGAAGAMETAVWLSCLEEGLIPKSFGFRQMDEEIGFAPAQKNNVASNGAYLCTFFGFGGTCTSYLIIKE